MKRLTTEEFIEKAKVVHKNKYDYSQVEYKSAFKKVKIICPIHGEFFQDPSNHLQGKGCPGCAKDRNYKARVKTTELFIEEAKIIHKNKYDYSKVIYTSANSKICIICPEHGEFLQTPHDHLNGSGCPKCSHHYSLTKEEFINMSNIIHNYEYDYSDLEYLTSKRNVKIICKKHGAFYLRKLLHLQGCGCSKCNHERAGFLRRKTTKEFIEQANRLHNNKYDYSKTEYTLIGNKVKIICPVHGEFLQIARDHLCGAGCPHCNLKSLHILFEKLLTYFPNNKIIFEASKKDIEWIGLQRLDIYFPEINVAVEYDGKQHFVANDFFGGLSGLEYRIIKDNLKELCCKNNNCILFRISYNYTEEDFQDLVIKIKQIYDYL